MPGRVHSSEGLGRTRATPAARDVAQLLSRTTKRERHPGAPLVKDLQLVGDTGEDFVDPPLLEHAPVVCDFSIDATVSVVDLVCEEGDALFENESVSDLVNEVVKFYGDFAVEACGVNADLD